jgi:hypothetical protein
VNTHMPFFLPAQKRQSQVEEEEEERRLKEAERQKRLQLDTSRKLFAAARKVKQQEELGKKCSY